VIKIGEITEKALPAQYSMTHRKRSPRNVASSVLSFSPPGGGHPVSHEIIRRKPSIDQALKIVSTWAATREEFSIMKEPRAIPIMTSLATSQRLL
jgi:hypothetical protein